MRQSHRQGKGRGLGSGYYNVLPRDPYIHSLSARGIKLPKTVGEYKIKYVTSDITRDYGAMNHESAMLFGFEPKIKKNVILVDKGMPKREQLEAINHELDEMEMMKQGYPYWDAHIKALDDEKHLRRLQANGIKVSTYTKNNFDIDNSNILNSTDKYNKEPVYNFMYNPRTGEMLMGGKTAHSDLLRSRDMTAQDKSNFNEWVRGKYDKDRKILYVRHYNNPKSIYSEFTSADFDLSEKMQKKMIDVLKKKGLPKDVTVRYNQTNETLRNDGFVYMYEV